jgi:hypothetical protein
MPDQIVASLLSPEVIAGLIEFENASNAERFIDLEDSLIERMIETGLLIPLGEGYLKQSKFAAWAVANMQGLPTALPIDMKDDKVH